MGSAASSTVTPTERSTDPRAERSRALLLDAAIRLVSERGTTDIPLTELVREAGVSRQVAYLHYAERDALVVESALHLMRTELTSATPTTSAREAVERVTAHFAAHRTFYRAIFTGPCCYAFTERMLALLRPFTLLLVPHVEGQTQLDAAAPPAGAARASTARWLSAPDDAATPAQSAHRLTAARHAIIARPQAPPPHSSLSYLRSLAA